MKSHCSLLLLSFVTVLIPTSARADVTLDTAHPLADFTPEGGQAIGPSPTVLLLNDASSTDIINLYSPDLDAAPGEAIELFAAFQIRTASLSGADSGVHFVINDGASKAIIAACIVQGGVKGIGLASGTTFWEATNYPVFVPVDWSRPTTLLIRRTAQGDAEIVEVNAVAPSPRALLTSALLSPRNRTTAAIDLGCTSPESHAELEVTQFFTRTPSPPLVPATGVTPALTSVTINAGALDDLDPHVSGDLVAYASGLTIRYYDFATGIDAQIPSGPSARDLLSDVSGSRIAFSRIITGVKTAVMVFDTANPGTDPIEIDPTATVSVTRLGTAIGGNTVAYIDSGLQGSGELVIHDLTSSTSVRVTDDLEPDQSPSVSPDGSTVTWEHCLSSLSNCDVWQAVKTDGGWWRISVTSGSARPEANPETSGALVVYDVLLDTGDRDIAWRPITGGAELRLSLPASYEADPSMMGHLVAFESRPGLFSPSDIYVYDIDTNLMFRITTTQDVTEMLDDISVTPEGDVHVVWTSDEVAFNQRNIRGATFRLPAGDDTPPELAPLTDVFVTLPPGSTTTSMTVTFPLPAATDDGGVVTVTTVPASGATFSVGATTVDVSAVDPAGNVATGSFVVTVRHAFSGFRQPVDESPAVNVVSAGQAVPVRFSLSGFKGLGIFAAGYPISSPIACDDIGPGSVIEETVAAGGSGLSYDAATDQYDYVWKTSKGWKGSCRVFVLRLSDGSDHFLKFRFR